MANTHDGVPARDDAVGALTATAAGRKVFSIQFSIGGWTAWLAPRKKSRWQWKGQGEIEIGADEITFRGRRARTLLPSTAQEVVLPAAWVTDVVVKGSTLSIRVAQPGAGVEMLTFVADDVPTTLAIAALLPTSRSTASLESEAFENALQSLGTRVLVTPTLVGANVLLFVLMVASGVDAMQPTGAEVIQWGSNYGPMTLHGQWWRLATSLFLHFGLIHLAFNMSALISLGPKVERMFGSVRFLLLYLIAGLAGSIASLLWNPFVNSAGASGAIFGVLGALLACVVNPAAKIPATVSRAQRNSALLFVGYNILNGLSHAGIDNAAHLGGLVAGFVLGWALARPLDPAARQGSPVKLVTTASIAVLTLFAGTWWLAHPLGDAKLKRNFADGVVAFSSFEHRAHSESVALDDELLKHAIDERTWGHKTLKVVVPLWQAAAEAADRLEAPEGSKLEPAKQALVEYVQSRKSFAEVSAEARLSGDKDTADRAASLANKAIENERTAARLLRGIL